MNGDGPSRAGNTVDLYSFYACRSLGRSERLSSSAGVKVSRIRGSNVTLSRLGFVNNKGPLPQQRQR